jgi:hypothetical protein
MKVFIFAVCLLSMFACVKRSAPPTVTVEPPILSEFAELDTLHRQFTGFRDDPRFLRYGFTFNSPYADWLQRVRDLEQAPALAEAARTLAGLAVAARINGTDSEVYRQFESRFSQALRTPAAEKQTPPSVAVSAPAILPTPQTIVNNITLLFSGDTQGVVYSQPGGFGPIGGLARRPPTIDHFRAEDPGTLVLDAGDAFVSGFAKAEAINKVLVRAMNHMRYDAMGLGPHDLAIGEVMLRELVSIASFPLICSNLQFQKGVEPWIKPYVLINRNQARIALVSLLPPASGVKITGAEFVPPRQALQAMLPELRAKADCIVLLTQFGSEEISALLGAEDAVDVILGDGKVKSGENPAYLPAMPKGLGFGLVRLNKSDAGTFRPVESLPVLMGDASDERVLQIMDELK